MRVGRHSSVAAVLAVLVLTLVACGGDEGDGGSGAGATPAPSAKPGEKVTLSFWSWVPGIDKAVDRFNQTHEDIKVNVNTITPGPTGGYAKMYSALKAGNAPDLAHVEYQELPGFVLEQGLVELSEYGAPEAQDKFVEWQWEQGVFGDSVYAIPQASGPMAFYYRADLFEKWGIEVPATWEEYRQAAEQIREKDPKAYIGTFPPTNSAWFTALAWQAGAKWFGTEGDAWTVNMADPNTLKVAEFWEGMIRDKLVKTETDFQTGWYKDLQQGEIVGWVSASWGDAILTGNAEKTKGDWRVAYIPQWEPGAKVSANWGGSSTAVLKGTEHPREAVEFAVWLNSDPESINLLIQGGYGWPAATAGSDAPALAEPPNAPFFGGQNIYDTFAEADQNIDKEWGWIPTTSAAYKHLNDGFTKAIKSGGSFADVVRTAQEQTVADLDAKGLEVKAGE
jgi:multiple sugar transport system substrate-binding protein